MSLIGLLGHPALDVTVCASELPAAKVTISNAEKTLVIICVPCGFHLTNDVKIESRRLEHLGSAQASRCNIKVAYTFAASQVRSTEAMSRSVCANLSSPGPYVQAWIPM